MFMETTPHILLVDDDTVDVMNVQKAFAKIEMNYPLHIANHGEMALDMLKGTNGYGKLNPTPCIILMDINMPRMNGIELLQEIRKDPELKMIYVFVFTTSDEDSDMLEAFNLNVAGYIIKPISFDQLVTALHTMTNYWDQIQKPVF